MSIAYNCITRRRRRKTPAVITCCNLRKPAPELQRELKTMMLGAIKHIEKLEKKPC